MLTRRLTPFLFLLLIQTVTAADDLSFSRSFSPQEYLIILFAGILLLGIFIITLKTILRRSETDVQQSTFMYALGLLIAFMFIAAGSLFFISAILILIAVISHMATFLWMVSVIEAYFGGSITFGILIIAALGLVLFLVGVYMVVVLQGNPFFNPSASPTRSGKLTKIDRGIEVELEVLNPTLTFKVLDRDKDEPLPDVKVILKQMNGTRVYTKFTDYNGEVTFHDIQGYGSEYFAYVEGDDRREKFRVLRKKAS